MLSSDKKVCNLLSKLERNPGWPTVPSENKTTRETSSKGKKWLELRSVSASTAFLKSHYFAFESCSRKAVVVAQLIERLLLITEIRGLNTNIGKVLSISPYYLIRCFCLKSFLCISGQHLIHLPT